MKIRMTHYSITSAPYGRGANHLRSWVVDGFVGGNWVELDRHEKDRSLNDLGAVKVFALRRSCIVTRIRLTQIGMNHDLDDALILSGTDVFGDVEAGH
jgi:hypothetical protein